jgi:hypothetical protein
MTNQAPRWAQALVAALALALIIAVLPTDGIAQALTRINAVSINGVAWLTGAGATGSGSPRVTEANDSQLSAGVGAVGDAAATAGGTGSLTAKMRLLTSVILNGRIKVDVDAVSGDAVASSSCDDPSKIESFNVLEASGTTTIEIVPLAASEVVDVCGFNLIADADANVVLAHGTGSLCGTNNTDRETLRLGPTLGPGIANPNGGASQFRVPAGNAFCIERGSATALYGRVTFVQQVP